jgi:hypothetical protein
MPSLAETPGRAPAPGVAETPPRAKASRREGASARGEEGASATPVAPGASATPGTQELTITEPEPPQATTSLAAVHSQIHNPIPPTTRTRPARAAPALAAAVGSP